MSTAPMLPVPDAALAPAAPAHLGEALYRAALGRINTGHYLTAFERFDATERMLPGWNWAAALCTLGWMVFRRLWVPLVVYLAGVAALVLGLAALVRLDGALPTAVLAGLTLACALLVYAVPGLYGDVLVHGQVRQRISAAVEAAPTVREALAQLERRAPSLSWLAAVALAMAATALLSALALWWLAAGRALPGQAVARQPTVAEQAVAAPAPDVQPAAPAPALEAQAPAVSGGPNAQPPHAASSQIADASEPQAPMPSGTAQRQPGATETSAAQDQLAPPAEVPAAVMPPANANATLAPDGATASAAGASTSLPTPSSAAAATSPAPLAHGKPVARVQRRTEPAAAPAAPLSGSRQLYVNVGLFAEDANARRAHAKLMARGLPSALRTVTARDGRRLQRVRVGPFTSTAEANAAAARVRALGLDAAAAARQAD